jgi:hypothetical protein
MRSIITASITFFALLSITACGSSGDGHGTNSHGNDPMGNPISGDPSHVEGSNTSDDSSAESINGQCVVNTLKGIKDDGESCSQANDCAPTCCSCDNGNPTRWLGARCLNGKCSSASVCSLSSMTSFYCK